MKKYLFVVDCARLGFATSVTYLIEHLVPRERLDPGVGLKGLATKPPPVS